MKNSFELTPGNLVPIPYRIIHGKPTPTVNARQLHEFLGVGRDFSSWIRNRVDVYRFEDGQDFVIHSSNFPQNGGKINPVSNQEVRDFTQNGVKLPAGRGRPATEYFLTLDMAKELAMVERTEKGRQARRYFIECERRLREKESPQAKPTPVPTPLSPDQRDFRIAVLEDLGGLFDAISQISDETSASHRLARVGKYLADDWADNV